MTKSKSMLTILTESLRIVRFTIRPLNRRAGEKSRFVSLLDKSDSFSTWCSSARVGLVSVSCRSRVGLVSVSRRSLPASVTIDLWRSLEAVCYCI